MSQDEKRMIEGYEVKAAIHINGKEIIFAEDIKAERPYMVCECLWDNPLGADEYQDLRISASYVGIMAEFTSRLNEQVQRLDAELTRRGMPHTPLTADDCLPRSEYADFTGQVIVLKPEKLAAFARTPDKQLYLVIDGGGVRPDSGGNAVFCHNLYTGEHCRRERYNVAGIIDPAKMPAWANEKLAALESKLREEKPSVMAQLSQAKQAAQQQSHKPKGPKKNGPEL